MAVFESLKPTEEKIQGSEISLTFPVGSDIVECSRYVVSMLEKKKASWSQLRFTNFVNYVYCQVRFELIPKKK